MPATVESLAPGGRIGNYQIINLIGAGGMGMVYKALDIQLQRTVALKFLTPSLSVTDKDREGVLREARAASGLDHNNIGVIYGLEQAQDGQLFIVMAYYEGQTVASKLLRGALAPAEALDIIRQVATGLGEAHSRRIVHGDIKPANIIVTRQGVAKIMDFGLARVVSASGATQSMSSGGTVAYMSPEQVGGRPASVCSDIWALGVMLCEMLTGANPFSRQNLSSIVFAIMNDPPPTLEGVPAALQNVAYHALSKDEAHRYQSCAEMLADLEEISATAAPATNTKSRNIKKSLLNASAATRAPGRLPNLNSRRRWRPAVAAVTALSAILFALPPLRQRVQSLWAPDGEKRIAVLPFDNIGNDPANAPVVEGLMDSMAAKLSNLDVGQQTLWVIPASEIRRRKIDDPAAALKELGATLAVKGSIQRNGKDVHLTVNLLDSKSLRQMGSAALEDRTGDISALQDEAISRLAQLMHIKVTAEMLRDTGGAVTPAAYEDYLKALGYMQRYDKAGNLELAVTSLENAVKTDSRFALGFAALGSAYQLKYLGDPNPKWVSEATANCQRALQLNNRLAAPYVTLGRIHTDAGQHDLAVQEFQHALDLNARDADALNGVAVAYEKAGRLQEAEATFQKAVALRPENWDGYNTLAMFYDRQNKFPEAIEQYQSALKLTPDNAQVYSNLASAYLDSGDPKLFPQAEAALKKSLELRPSYPAYANMGAVYSQQNRHAEAAAMMEKALALNDKNFRVWENLALECDLSNQSAKAAAAREHELPLLEQSLKVKPDDAPMQSFLALLYVKKKQRDLAVSRIKTALALSPTNPEVLENAGEVYEALGERAIAIQYVNQALQRGFQFELLKTVPGLQGLLSDPKFRPSTKQLNR